MSDWAAAWAVDLFGWASGFWRPWGHGAEDPWGWVAEDSAGGGFVGGGGKGCPNGDLPNGLSAGISLSSPVLAAAALGLGLNAETAAGAAFPKLRPARGSIGGLSPRRPDGVPQLRLSHDGCDDRWWCGQLSRLCPGWPQLQHSPLSLGCPPDCPAIRPLAVFDLPPFPLDLPYFAGGLSRGWRSAGLHLAMPGSHSASAARQSLRRWSGPRLYSSE